MPLSTFLRKDFIRTYNKPKISDLVAPCKSLPQGPETETCGVGASNNNMGGSPQGSHLTYPFYLSLE